MPKDTTPPGAPRAPKKDISLPDMPTDNKQAIDSESAAIEKELGTLDASSFESIDVELGL
jgi:hypothetical protein